MWSHLWLHLFGSCCLASIGYLQSGDGVNTSESARAQRSCGAHPA